MKTKYIELMEKALSAYTDEHIQRYFNDVKTNGLTEHGFPRLTANIGILISHGRRRDLLPIFLEMMEFCCKTIPTVKAANDFSVREIVCCLLEVEQSGTVSNEETMRWRGYLASIEPTKCYDRFATSPTDTVRNWALFTCVSEYFRQMAGLCDTTDFIELQLVQQLQWLDENGMYMDNPKHEQQQPIMYDLVPRGLFSLLLDQGYRGTSYGAIDEALRKAGLLTLDMQSPNGEMAFGGRSNQFLYNEAWLIAVFEYEAKRYAREGNAALAKRFKAASARALCVTEEWLGKEPIRHIKNRFPTETKYGCEGYAYFDKYMITVASNLYAAYQICDDSIPFEETPDHEPCVTVTSKYFHKLFLKSGGYGLEFDLNADPHYDASGLGRIHREGAPSTICLSVPCPASGASYTVDLNDSIALSLCPAVREDGKWHFATDPSNGYDLLELSRNETAAFARLACQWKSGARVVTSYHVDDSGVLIELTGKGELAYILPAFDFDGEMYTELTRSAHQLAVAYQGWVCRYTTNAQIEDSGKLACNRNGHYRVFYAKAEDTLWVKAEILPAGEAFVNSKLDKSLYRI